MHKQCTCFSSAISARKVAITCLKGIFIEWGGGGGGGRQLWNTGLKMSYLEA